MAIRTVKARLELDGEKQYKEALSEINKGSQVLGSEMKKLQAQFKGNTDSTEFLTQKSELLEREILNQTEKLQTLRDALANAAKQYGEADKRTMEWQIKVNNAEAALYNLGNAYQETTQKLSENVQTINKAKNASQEYARGNEVLKSELKKLEAQCKGNTESTEFLTKKGEILTSQLENQKNVVAKAKEALEAAKKEYGENAAETQELTIKLNEEEAAYYDLEHAIDENNAALQGEDETMQGLGDTVSDLAGKFGVTLPQSAQDALNSMGSFSSGTIAALGLAAGAVTAVIGAVKKLNEITLEAATHADDLITKSMTTGVSTRTLHQWEYAQNLIDVSVDTMAGSLRKLTLNMDSARDGNAKLAQAFADLGVTIQNQDGSLRDAEAVLLDVIDALGGIENPTERDAAAMELLGKSAQELNPLILQGSDALKALAAEAEETGYVLDESQIAKLGEVDDAYQRMQNQIEATKQQLAAEFAPASTKVMEDFTRVVKEGGKALKNSGIVTGIGEMLTYSTAMLEPVGALLGLVPEATNDLKPLYTVLHGIAGAFAWIADAGNAAVGVLQALTIVGWKQGTTRFNTALGWNAKYGMYSNMQKWADANPNVRNNQYNWEAWRNSADSGYAGKNYGYDSETGLYYDRETGDYIFDHAAASYRYKSHNAGGTDNWRGGYTWVGEAGPELVRLPAGSQILSNQESRNAGGDTFYITIDAKSVKDFNDVVELCKNARVMRRMRG